MVWALYEKRMKVGVVIQGTKLKLLSRARRVATHLRNRTRSGHRASDLTSPFLSCAPAIDPLHSICSPSTVPPHWERYHNHILFAILKLLFIGFASRIRFLGLQLLQELVSPTWALAKAPNPHIWSYIRRHLPLSRGTLPSAPL